jgi:hypothetical protein
VRLRVCGTVFSSKPPDVTGFGDVTGFTMGPTFATEAVAVTAATASAAVFSFFAVRTGSLGRRGAIGGLDLAVGSWYCTRLGTGFLCDGAGFGQLRGFRD